MTAADRLRPTRVLTPEDYAGRVRTESIDLAWTYDHTTRIRHRISKAVVQRSQP